MVDLRSISIASYIIIGLLTTGYQFNMYVNEDESGDNKMAVRVDVIVPAVLSGMFWPITLSIYIMDFNDDKK